MKKLVCVSLIYVLFGLTAFAQVGIKTEKVEENAAVQSKLSTLWTAVTLNMITADVLSLYIPEGMDDWEDFADGNEADFMLGGAIMYQIPISMVFLSKILPYKANRRANIIAAGLMTAAVVAGGSTDPHYMVCAGAEIVGFSLIAWNAWKWQDSEGKDITNKHNIDLNANYDNKAYSLTYTYKF